MTASDGPRPTPRPITTEQLGTERSEVHTVSTPPTNVKPEAIDLGERLAEIEREHLRLAAWNRSKDRPARCVFHHDAALTLRDARQSLRDMEAENQRLAEALGIHSGVKNASIPTVRTSP